MEEYVESQDQTKKYEVQKNKELEKLAPIITIKTR
jgi:hypothetical protein